MLLYRHPATTSTTNLDNGSENAQSCIRLTAYTGGYDKPDTITVTCHSVRHVHLSLEKACLVGFSIPGAASGPASACALGSIAGERLASFLTASRKARLVCGADVDHLGREWWNLTSDNHEVDA